MFENIALSFQGIWAHKMRAFLTMLGIIIGIASIITIVSTINGTNNQIKENLIGSGTNAVKVALYQGDWEYEMEYSSPPAGVPVITRSVMDEILALDEVESAALFHRRNTYNTIFHGAASLSGGYLYGADNDYFTVYGYSVQQGRGFSDKDFEKYHTVAILDTTAAKTLFNNENPIGKTLEINGIAYTVIGIVRQSERSRPVINSIEDYYMYADNSSGAVFVNYTTWPQIYKYDEPQSVAVRATSTDDMAAAGKNTADIINSYLTTSDSTLKYKDENLLERAKELQALSNATGNMLLWIAAISLLVGGIGVMNIMLVSVTERTREIGLKKALGAKKIRILGQFLTEATVLSGFGGVLGVGCGIGLSFIVSNVAEIPVAISVPAALVAVIFSMFVGMVFGILPSVNAAKLNPIEALRRE